MTADTVRIERLDLAVAPGLLPMWEESLSDEERIRCGRLIRPEDRRRYISAHAQLREILAGHLNVSPSDVKLGRGPHGKPECLNYPQVRFSLSHHQDRALVAVRHCGAVGVDIELVRALPELENMALEVMTTAEHAQFAALPARQRLGAFYRLWTRKEAYLKARGCGLLGALDEAPVFFDGPTQISSTAAGTWLVQPIPEEADWVAAVAWQELAR